MAKITNAEAVAHLIDQELQDLAVLDGGRKSAPHTNLKALAKFVASLGSEENIFENRKLDDRKNKFPHAVSKK